MSLKTKKKKKKYCFDDESSPEWCEGGGIAYWAFKSGQNRTKTIQLNFVQMPFLGKNISGGTE